MKKRTSCYGKVKHKNINQAFAAKRNLLRDKGLTARVYKCKRCGFYHVGKPSFYDNPMEFWNNIFNQMSEEDLKKLSSV